MVVAASVSTTMSLCAALGLTGWLAAEPSGGDGVAVALAAFALAPACASWLRAPAAARRGRLFGHGLALVLAVALGLWRGQWLAFALALQAAALIHTLCLPAVAAALPERIATLGQRRRWALLWCALALGAAGQTARMGIHVVDDTARIGWPLLFRAPGHQCLPAYLRAAELARAGVPDLYAPSHYAHGQPTAIAGMEPHVRDPYQYPPTALWLPRLAHALSDRFQALRAGWFVLQSLGFAWLAWWIAGALDGRSGVAARLSWPLIWLALPTLHNFAFGQVHLLAVAAAWGGMLAFARRRDALGGVLLGTAIAVKLFPAVLLLTLALQRRFEPIAKTVATLVALCLVSLLVLGSQPFEAFIADQLPRLLSGEAFARFIEHTDHRNPHLSPSASVFTLRALGMPASFALSRAVSLAYAAVLVALAVAARRLHPQAHPVQGLAWLGLLNLAAAQSPYAPAAYVIAPMLWGFGLWLVHAASGRLRALLAAAWLLFGLTPFLGKMPVFWAMPRFGAAVAVAVAASCVALGAWMVLRFREPTRLGGEGCV